MAATDGIKNYTTKIDPHNTIAEITKILVKHNCRKIAIDYGENGTPEALTFQVHTEAFKTPLLFALPARSEGVLKAMQKQKIPKSFINKDQALRVSWRIIKDWVDSQMAMVQAEVCEIQEIFLPYLVMPAGNTLYDEVKTNSKKYLPE